MRKGNMTILASVIAIALVAAGVGMGTMAFFSDTETSTGNTFTAGKIDLVLDMWDGEKYVEYNGVNMQVFDVEDLKPGDSGEVTISLHVYDNDAWIWADFSYVEYENDRNEPEALVDGTPDDGELAENMDILIWWDYGLIAGWQGRTEDPKEGDNLYDPGEPIFYEGLQSDMPVGYHGPFVIVGCETVYMGILWSVDSGVGNIIQSDSLVSAVTFYVEQLKNNPSPVGP